MKPMILVVDDEKSIRRVISTYLQSEGFPVMEAEDGQTALRIVNELPVSLVVLDIMLPGLKVWQICSEIKRIKDIPVIIITACGNEATKILSFDAGADDFLTKPFNPKELLLRIKAIMRRTEESQKMLQAKQ